MRNEKGQFEKGNKGKPKGAANHTTKEVKQLLTNFIHDKVDDLHNVYDTLDDKDKATLLIHICKLILPKAENENENILNRNTPQPIWQIVDNSEPTPTPITFINKSYTPQEAAKRLKELEDEY